MEDPGGKSLTIVSYNMYLLFDDIEDGDEYYPFNESGGYTEEAYSKRLDLYRKFFLSDIAEADIYILSEVESEKAIIDLLSGELANKGYKFYSISDSNNPISVVFFSRIPVNDIKVHSNSGPRNILELELFIFGEKVCIYGIHAKSRIDGGEEERKSAFSHLSSLMQDNGLSLSIAVGDFNEDPRYGENIADVQALPDAHLKVTGDPLLTSYNVFYDPALDPENGDMSTYYYDGKWYAYDNVLLSSAAFDGSGLEYAYAEVIWPEDGISADGVPLKFDIEAMEGYSDHLALKVRLDYNG